jgi:uncharacterized membrane protein (DUF373 family)
MIDQYPGEKLVNKFEVVAVIAVEILLVLAVAIGIIVLYVLFVQGVSSGLSAINNVSDMQHALQRVFAGALLVLMGLELIETIKTYFSEHHVKIEVILVVAMIAMGRHLVQLDFEHMSGSSLAGVAALLLALAISYALVKRVHRKSDLH